MAEFPAGLQVQVCYCSRPGAQILHDVTVAEGATLHDAIRESGILADAPEIDLTVFRIGIYGKLRALDSMVRDRDRIEIYRPLLADPKESRRNRALRKSRQDAQ